MGKNNIMVDLETMGNSERSAIVSIGACKFGDGKLHDSFYEVVELESSVKAGLELNVGTIEWWLKQSSDARQIFTNCGAISLKDALQRFGEWITPTNTAEIWGNGADFDNVILKNAYDACGMPLPWKYWNNRCYRTIKGLNKTIKVKRAGTHHNALDDAKTQAEHLMRMMPNIGA